MCGRQFSPNSTFWHNYNVQGRIQDFSRGGGYFCKGDRETIHCLITKIRELGDCFLYFSYALAQNGGGGWLVTRSTPWIRHWHQQWQFHKYKYVYQTIFIPNFVSSEIFLCEPSGEKDTHCQRSPVFCQPFWADHVEAYAIASTVLFWASNANNLYKCIKNCLGILFLIVMFAKSSFYAGWQKFMHSAQRSVTR